jgi:hypothetical protein
LAGVMFHDRLPLIDAFILAAGPAMLCSVPHLRTGLFAFLYYCRACNRQCPDATTARPPWVDAPFKDDVVA